MKRPPKLRPGDTIALVAPARSITEEKLADCIQSLENWGLKVLPGANLLSEYHQYAGTDAQRAADLQAALDNPKVKAIMTARGGYGTLRVVDQLDLSVLKNNPKWIIGFSDLTVLAMDAVKQGVQAIHGPMAISWDGKTGNQTSFNYLRELLMETGEAQYKYQPLSGEFCRPGQARGPLIGGNLSLLVNMIGTPSDFDTKGKILFIEDLDEYFYHFDRMLLHLKRAGKLEGLAGLIAGGFTDVHDNSTPFGKEIPEIILDAVGDYDFPVCFDFPCGHWPQNYPLILGAEAKLSVSHSQVELSFPR